MKNENFSGYGEDFTKVLVYTDLGIICASTPHRSETNGIAERAVRRTTEGTSAGLLQSVLDENGGLILWNAIFMWKNFPNSTEIYSCDQYNTQIWMCCKKAVLMILGMSTKFALLNAKPPKDVCFPGGGLRRFKQLPDWTMCGLKVSPTCQKQPGRRSRKGLLKSQRSTTHEEREAFVPSIRKIWRVQRNHQNARQRLEIPVEAAMPCKMETKKRLEKLLTTESESDESNNNPKDKACTHRTSS